MPVGGELGKMTGFDNFGTVMQDNTPTTFKEAYEILRHNAHTLEHDDNIDIDHLVGVVEQSIVAYKVCQERIAAVETALQHAFKQTV